MKYIILSLIMVNSITFVPSVAMDGTSVQNPPTMRDTHIPRMSMWQAPDGSLYTVPTALMMQMLQQQHNYNLVVGQRDQLHELFKRELDRVGALLKRSEYDRTAQSQYVKLLEQDTRLLEQDKQSLGRQIKTQANTINILKKQASDYERLRRTPVGLAAQSKSHDGTQTTNQE
jgi:hypothetical protein